MRKSVGKLRTLLGTFTQRGNEGGPSRFFELAEADRNAQLPGHSRITIRSVGIFAMVVALSACSKHEEAAAPARMTVTVATPLSQQVVDWDEYIGHFQAPQSVELRSRVTGVVTEILFEDGQETKEGQPLFTIDPRPYKAELKQAQAHVARSEAALTNATSVEARSTQLVKAQAVSKEELENDQAKVRTARAELLQAQAEVTNAELNLSFTTVRSPVTGRASNRRVSLGDHVTAGTTLLTKVVSLDPIWFTFDGAESFYLKYMRQAQLGQRGSSRESPNVVEVQLSDEKGYPHHGHMVFVDNAVDPESGTIQAHAVIPNSDHFLTPGMFGRARLVGSGRYQAMLIPDEVIMADQSLKQVYVVSAEGVVAKRTVETGPKVSGLRAIRGGLAPTDQVVLGGLNQLQPGMKVDVFKGKIEPKINEPQADVQSVTYPQSRTATTPAAS